MKKLCLTLVFLGFFWFSAFGDTGGQREVDFLLFAPNSSDTFVYEQQAIIQLDDLARYLLRINPAPGQIEVHGYAASAKNNIDPLDLSQERALFVINELQRRGVPPGVFSTPVGHGEVDLWGSNVAEADRSPNRRVRVLLDGAVLTAAMAAAPEESRAAFPWAILLPLLALIAAIILFISGFNRKVTAPPVYRNSDLIIAAADEDLVNLEEEIRRRAYELYQKRNGQDGDANGDWYRAVPEICAQYEAAIYQVYAEDGSWWAHRYR